MKNAYVAVGLLVICETYDAASSATVLAQVVDSTTVDCSYASLQIMQYFGDFVTQF